MTKEEFGDMKALLDKIADTKEKLKVARAEVMDKRKDETALENMMNDLLKKWKELNGKLEQPY